MYYLRPTSSNRSVSMVRVTKITDQRKSTCLFVLVFCALFIAIASPAQSVVKSEADTVRINRWWYVGLELLSINNDSAKAYSQKIIRQSRQINYPYGLARGYALAGAAMRNGGEFDSSIQYAQKALTIFETQARPEGIPNVYNLLALTYKRMGDAQRVKLLTQKALKYAYMARQSALKTHNYSELSRAYNTLGITYRDLNQSDSAKAYYLRAIAVENQHHPYPSYLPVCYANYGQILMDADKDFPKAIAYFQKAIPLYEKQRSVIGQEHVYRNLSWAYRQQGNHKMAIQAADRSLALGRIVDDPHRLFNSLQAAYLAYRDAGQFHKALAYLEEWKHREDSLVNVEKTRAIATLESSYESQKKEIRINQLAQENKGERRQMAFLTAGLVTVLLLLGILWWQYQNLRRSRFQIRQQADQLALMMKELHHRVKNNLAIVSSLLRLQANQLTDQRVIRVIQTSQQRVEAMALIHQRLYHTNNVTTVNIREYLTDLVHSLMEAYGYTSVDINLQIDITKEWLEVDIAMPLGLIVNELATNSFKHAYEFVDRPMLRISLHDKQGLVLEVQDNGPGVTSADWEKKGKRSFGKQLVASLCQQLAGIVEIKQQDGALFQMRFANTVDAI